MIKKSRITTLLGIKYPIIQGGMAWLATAELAAAVANGGGLGLIAAGNAPGDWVREQIHKARALTTKPFGVNVMLLSPYVDEVIRIIIEEKIPVITTGAGNPGKYMPALKEAGVKVIPVVNSVSLAKRLEKAGVDAVIGEGMEAGGHIGTETTMVLIPQLADALEVPVIAAGGIADGRGMAAAFVLGAEGVQVGTRFICAEECIVHEDYKKMVLKATDRSTVITGQSTGHPVRVLKNKLARRFLEAEAEGVPPAELEAMGAGKLAAAFHGDVEEGSVMAGQSAALVNRIEPAAAIIEEMVSKCRELLGDC
ncbi:enoyl-[acyl-carrier-protein] reductase FabK [Capillibacterium thermochitinicola]|uniref:Probable nitronate monooxygenase n=1 Tax=Capillibacterium thermochitinicola TaxID=2699427 RepID=A0A8J6I0L8_9FIRM|nr:enoyl-[acyl-carrier-protein] reductase FabK [Capillibacterium thermochitinicola]MBA2133078.1 enoyl-[acyl-carrier-protein] reductase FabK [Capillibacterium thermochitinicola]